MKQSKNFQSFQRHAVASKVFFLFVWLLLAVNILSGCALVRFENVEEEKQEEDILSSQDQPIDFQSLLLPSTLEIEENLADDSGVVIATYHAALPYFDNPNDTPIIDRINEFYEIEFNFIKEDKEQFFSNVTEAAKDTPFSSPAKCEYGFDLLNNVPEGVISVIRKYKCFNTLGSGNQVERDYCEVFSATTGWRLRFSDLFSSSEEAMNRLNAALLDWGKSNGVTENQLGEIEKESLTEDLAIDNDTLYLGTSSLSFPNEISLIELPLDSFRDILTIK